MPTPKAEVCTVSSRQRQLLEQISRRGTNPHRLVERAKLVLLAADGINNTFISEQLEMNRNQVRMWRGRWVDARSRLTEAETLEISEQKLQQLIISVLSDQPRSGSPAKFTVDNIVQIVAVACEHPSQSERPINEWSRRELAEEAVKRGIVTEISQRSVGRFLCMRRIFNLTALDIG
ncbi:helix-turn-helix domain-containing protein [Oscillatoria sp. HE19RPO]|uniref:helix-turn-helix domain-containing protein n=1 Tax=Oscillatoria sp. HE19RPO TaxID=2954806 RepID=UPI0020C562D8|nr:helix-turn-helix domain-containing protein [Oscillatoria sp. HE19RPO]